MATSAGTRKCSCATGVVFEPIRSHTLRVPTSSDSCWNNLELFGIVQIFDQELTQNFVQESTLQTQESTPDQNQESTPSLTGFRILIRESLKFGFQAP